MMPFAVKTLKSRYFYLILCLVFVLMFPFVNYIKVFFAIRDCDILFHGKKPRNKPSLHIESRIESCYHLFYFLKFLKS